MTRRRKIQKSKFCKENGSSARRARRDDDDDGDDGDDGDATTAMIETRRRKNQNSKFGRIRGQILNFDFCKNKNDDGDATTATDD